MRHLFALLLAAMLSTCAAAPVLAQACVPIADVVASFSAHPMTASVHVASPAEAKLAVEIYNAMPPESDDKYDTVVLATATTEAGMVLLGNDGQICHQAVMPADMWRVFLFTVLGRSA